MLRTTTDEPQHEADAHDRALTGMIDGAAEDQLTVADIRVNGAHATVSAKPKPHPKNAKANAKQAAMRAKHGKCKRRDDATPLDVTTYVQL